MKNILNTPFVQNELQEIKEMKSLEIIDRVKEGYKDCIELEMGNKPQFYNNEQYYLYERDKSLQVFDDKRAIEHIKSRLERGLPVL